MRGCFGGAAFAGDKQTLVIITRRFRCKICQNLHPGLFGAKLLTNGKFERVKLASTLSSVFSCLEIVMKYSHSFLK